MMTVSGRKRRTNTTLLGGDSSQGRLTLGSTRWYKTLGEVKMCIKAAKCGNFKGKRPHPLGDDIEYVRKENLKVARLGVELSSSMLAY